MKKFFRASAFFAAIGLALAFSACSHDGSVFIFPLLEPTPKKGSISYASASLRRTTFDDAFTNALTKTGDGAVEYSSSEQEVATVDAFGKVTITGEGTTTITATVSDSATYSYAVKSASYTLSVTDTSVNAPLTLEALADGTITLTNPPSTFKYKKNSEYEQTVTASGNPPQATIAVVANDRVCLLADGTENEYRGNPNYFTIDCSADCYLYGNVMSLEDSHDYSRCVTVIADNEFNCLFAGNKHIKNHVAKTIVLPATELKDGCYYFMFDSCQGLTKAPKLPAAKLKKDCYKSMFQDCKKLARPPELPATELAEDCYRCMFYSCENLEKAPALPAVKLQERCYEGMFSGCKKLAKAPELPATELAEHCYDSMFDACVGLTEAPALPATTLAPNCYQGMFIRCKGFTQAPELPAETLAEGCYYQMFCECSSLKTAPVLKAKTLVADCYWYMFYKCASLSHVKCLATNISANRCLEVWMKDVPPGGTFVKAAGIDVGVAGGWKKDSADGIPAGWTVQDAD